MALGGLMTYGPNLADRRHRAAGCVTPILRSARPAELPAKQPATFDFVIKLTTGQALGLTIPPAVLAQAIEVVQ